jgi:hypothetical protein
MDKTQTARRKLLVLAACLTVLASGAALADPLNVQATMLPKEQIRLDFKDGSGHFVLIVRREGVASGTGLLLTPAQP